MISYQIFKHFVFSTAHVRRWTNASATIAYDAGSSDRCPRTTHGELLLFLFSSEGSFVILL